MKRILLALALLLLPSLAMAQCNGVFPNSTVCGNATGSSNTPRPTSPSAFQGSAGGTNGQIQYNNSGALGGFTQSGDCTTNTSTGVTTCFASSPLATGRGGTGANNSTNTTGDVLASNGTNGNFVHTALLSLINTLCGLTPGTCTSLYGCSQATWYGFVGDGTTANDTAFTNWWTAIASSPGACLEFNVGKYIFSSAVSKTMAAARQSIQIRGLGIDASILSWAAGGGLTIAQGSALNSINIHDLTFQTGAANTGTALALTSSGVASYPSQSFLTNISVRGDDYIDVGSNSHYWALGVGITGWSNVTINTLNTYGLTGAPGSSGGGIGLEYGGQGTNIVIILTVLNSNFSWHSIGFELLDYWEGVVVQNCNFQGEVGVAGLYAATGTHNGPLLNILHSQFNTAGTQVDIQTPANQVSMIGNTITAYGASSTGAVMGTGASVTAIGNLFDAAGGTPSAHLQLNGQNGIVEGNTFIGSAVGVLLASSSINVNVSQNTYQGTTTKVSNLGTSNSVGAATD